jgi:hypothetical protein
VWVRLSLVGSWRGLSRALLLGERVGGAVRRGGAYPGRPCARGPLRRVGPGMRRDHPGDVRHRRHALRTTSMANAAHRSRRPVGPCRRRRPPGAGPSAVGGGPRWRCRLGPWFAPAGPARDQSGSARSSAGRPGPDRALTVGITGAPGAGSPPERKRCARSCWPVAGRSPCWPSTRRARSRAEPSWATGCAWVTSPALKVSTSVPWPHAVTLAA